MNNTLTTSSQPGTACDFADAVQMALHLWLSVRRLGDRAGILPAASLIFLRQTALFCWLLRDRFCVTASFKLQQTSEAAWLTTWFHSYQSWYEWNRVKSSFPRVSLCRGRIPARLQPGSEHLNTRQRLVGWQRARLMLWFHYYELNQAESLSRGCTWISLSTRPNSRPGHASASLASGPFY